MWCDGRPLFKWLHARSGLVALADDDLQKGTKVRGLVVGR